eukprot:275316_1
MMWDQHSKKFWTVYFAEILIGSCFYGLLYFIIYMGSAFKKDSSPKHCLSVATNIASTINSFLMVAFFMFFFIDKRWGNPIKDQPKAAGHAYAFFTSYMLMDLLLHIIMYSKYPNTIIPRRYLIIIHHVLSSSLIFLIAFPDPYYGWSPLNCAIGAEVTTIFLNFQWFAAYFKNSKLASLFILLFVITWFTVRLPIFGYIIWWMIFYWDRIFDEMPFRIAFFSIFLSFAGSLIQIPWTIMIISKLIKVIWDDTPIETVTGMEVPHTQVTHGVTIEMIQIKSQKKDNDDKEEESAIELSNVTCTSNI